MKQALSELFNHGRIGGDGSIIDAVVPQAPMYPELNEGWQPGQPLIVPIGADLAVAALRLAQHYEAIGYKGEPKVEEL